MSASFTVEFVIPRESQLLHCQLCMQWIHAIKLELQQQLLFVKHDSRSYGCSRWPEKRIALNMEANPLNERKLN